MCTHFHLHTLVSLTSPLRFCFRLLCAVVPVPEAWVVVHPHMCQRELLPRSALLLLRTSLALAGFTCLL